MTKNQKSSLSSKKNSRRSEKRAPHSVNLRFEALESRELLSVNPADSTIASSAYDAAALAESYGAIELPALDDAADSLCVSVAASEQESPTASFAAQLAQLQSDAYLESSYAVIFIGATDGARSYNAAKKSYEILSDNMRIAPDNIYILFGDASARNAFDWSFVGNVADANYENLSSLLAGLDRMMNENSNLLFLTTDNGVANQTFYCDGGETITGAQMRDALYQIQSGYVSCFFPKRDAGDAVDAIFDPATGDVYKESENASGDSVVYRGGAVFGYDAVYSCRLPEAETLETAESRIVVSYAQNADGAENAHVRSVGDGELVIAEGISLNPKKIIKGAVHLVSKVVDGAKDAWDGLSDSVKGGVKTILNIGKDIGKDLLKGDFKAAWNDVWQNKFTIGATLIGAFYGGAIGSFIGGGIGGEVGGAIGGVIGKNGYAIGSVIGKYLDGGGFDTDKVFEIISSSNVLSTNQNLVKNIVKTAKTILKIWPLPQTAASISVKSVLSSAGEVVLNLENADAEYQATSVGYRETGTSNWIWTSVAGKTFVDGTKTAYTLSNLKGGTQYDVCSKILINTAEGPVEIWSQNCCVSTPKQVEAPRIDKVVKESSTQLVVSWTPKDVDHTTGYVVSYTNMTTNETLTVNASRSQTSIVLGNLQENTKYCISIKAKGDYGVGDYGVRSFNFGAFGESKDADFSSCTDSDWTTTYVTTPKTLALGPLVASPYSNDLLSAFEWSTPPEAAPYVLGYKLQYRRTGSGEDGWVTVTLTENNMPNLPSGHYEFRYSALLKGDKFWSTRSESFFTQVAKRHLVSTSGNTGDSLQHALDNLDDGDLIVFTEAMKGKTITLSSTLSIAKSVTIDASRCMDADGTPGVTIDANGKQAFNFSANATNVALNGLKIINASTTANGGAIYSAAQNLSVTNCVFENNAANSGAAIYVAGTSAAELNLTIRNSVFNENNSTNSGGAIFVNGDKNTSNIQQSSLSSVISGLLDKIRKENEPVGASGMKSGSITISDSKFANNSESSPTASDNNVITGGGAIYFNGNNTPPITIERSSFTNNKSTTSRGGAIAFGSGTIATIKDAEFNGNTSASSGGAVEAWRSSDLTIDNSRFIGNSVSGDVKGRGYGGALHSELSSIRIVGAEFGDNSASKYGGAFDVYKGSLDVLNASIHGNVAIEYGGAMKLTALQGIVDNTLVYDNDGGACGGAICYVSDDAGDNNSTTLILSNSTIADNVATNGSALYIRTATSNKVATLDAVNSIILPSANGAAGTVYVEGTKATLTATNVLSTDSGDWNTVDQFWSWDATKPLFTDAVKGDYTLAEGSQAFNRGSDFYSYGAAEAIDEMRDLAGAPRQVGGRVDLGAYESQEYESRSWTVTTEVDSENEGSLRYALANAHKGDAVLFDDSLRGKTITLTSGELPIIEGITIDATNLYDEAGERPGLTISGAGRSRVFSVWRDAGNVSIVGLTIANGSADMGGGIYKGENSKLTLENCVVEYNIAETGGGGGVCAEGGELRVVGTKFLNNRTLSTNTSEVDRTRGGGISVSNCPTAVVSSTFIGNKSQSHVGAIVAYNSQLDVESSTFALNTAANGLSAIQWLYGSSGSVNNSLFYRNTSAKGDVMELSSSGAQGATELTIENTTIVNNSASGSDNPHPAVALYTQPSNQSATLNVNNSIIAFNNGVQYGSTGTPKGVQTFNVHNTLVTQNVGTTNGNIYYTGAIDALFADAARDDYTLVPGSVAVNAGSNDYVTVTADLAGATRVQAGRVDLGAFERIESRTIVVKSATDDANDEESLRYAVDHARHGDYIVFSDALAGKTITLNSPLVLTKTITIDATYFVPDISGDNAPELDAEENEYKAGLALDGAGMTKLISVNAEGQTVALKGLIFAHALAGSADAVVSSADGGAVENRAGDLTLSQCVFVYNKGYFGAALLNAATATVDGCEFRGNEAYYGGGAIFNASGASLTIADSQFDGNMADAYVDGSAYHYDSNVGSRFGGAIMNYSGRVEIDGSEFTNNATHGDEGGAIYNYKGSFVVRNSKLNANFSTNVGGALMNYKGVVVISGSELSSNVAEVGLFKDPELGETTALPAGGGAIFNYEGTLVVDSSRLTRNSSDNYYGGAIYSLDATLTVSNSTLSENRAGVRENGDYVEGSGSNLGAGRGGAIFVHSKRAANYSNATITNSIIVRNNAGYGGGVFVQNANVELDNTDVAYNVSKYEAGGLAVDTDPVWRDGVGATLDYSTVDVYNSIVVANESAEAEGTFSDVYKGTDGTKLNAYGTLSGWNSSNVWTVGGRDFYFREDGPLFVDPENGDFRLTVDSQAINRGVEYGGMPERDLEGAPRIVNGRSDLGPYELQTERTPRTITVSRTTSFSNSLTPGTLAYALATAQYGDTIVFDETLRGKTISLQKEFVVSQSITIDASALYDETTNTPGITLSGAGRTRIFRIDPLAANVTFVGLKFANGKTTQGSNNQSGDEFYGGAIYTENADLTIRDCVFENNQGVGYGGAICATYVGENHTVNIENSRFIGNKASFAYDSANSMYGQGGAMVVESYGAPSEHGVRLTINDSLFQGNTTDQTDGVGHGGAIAAYEIDVEINRSVFKRNSSYHGGACNFSASETTISNSIFAENTSSGNGGAIRAYAASTSLRDTILRLQNSTVVDNVTNKTTGAIFLRANAGKTLFEAYNSIVAFNVNGASGNSKADISTQAQNGGKIETIGYNVLSSFSSWSSGSGQISSEIYSLDDVFFMPDENDDSGLPEYYLQTNSPARDRAPAKGSSTFYNSFVDSSIDLRGGSRIQGQKVDMGAYEYGHNVYDFSPISPTLPVMTIIGDPTTGSTLEVSWSSVVAPTAEFQWFSTDVDQENWIAIDGATSTEYTLTLADAGRRVKATATPTGYFVGNARSSQASDVITAQLATPSVEATEVGPTTVTLRCDEVERAEGYRVAYRSANSEEWTFVENPATSRVFELTGLSPNTRYELRCVALGNASDVFESEYGETIVVTTSDNKMQLRDIAGDFMVGEIASAVLVQDCAATWQWYRAEEQGEWSAIEGATSPDYVVTSDDLGRLLRVDVVAAGADGYQGSDSMVARGLAWTTLPAPTLTVASTTSDSISLQWSEVPGAIGYRLIFREESSDEWYCVDDLDENGGCTFEELDPETTYEFKMIAIGDGAVYLSSEYGETVTASPGSAALSVTAYDPETRQATIEWGAISGASKYTVKLSKDGGATWSNYKTNLTATSLTVNGLYAGKSYAFRVTGYGSDGSTLDGVLEVAFAPVSVTASIQDYTVGTPITVKLSAAENASATIQWYFITSDGDVEIVEARDALTYTPTSADYDIRIVTTGTGDSAPCVHTLTLSRPIDAAPITVRSYDAETRVALIRWDFMPGAEKYTVKISRDGGATWVNYISKISNNYKGINGVYAGRSYDFRVYGIASDGTTLERYAAGTVAPVTLSSTTTSYSVGSTITVRQTGAENASATIKWYSVTPTKDVEIVSARNQLTYVPTSSDYDIKVVATGTGDSKGCSSTLVLSAPLAVTATIYDASTRQATIEWGALAGASKYTVKLSKDGGTTWSNYKTNLTTTSTTVNGLYIGKTYGFRVVGYDATGTALDAVIEGTFAPIAISSSTTSYTVGSTITVRQTGAENASATIKWYNVTPTKDVEIVSARNQLTYVPTSSDYDIKVVATGTGDSKGCSSTLVFSAPLAVTVTSYDVTTRQATIEWGALAGASKYTVKLSKDGGTTWTNYKTNLTTTTTMVNGLYVGKTYGFRVVGYGATGAELDSVIEGTFTPTNDAGALLDKFFADFFEEELFEEI